MRNNIEIDTRNKETPEEYPDLMKTDDLSDPAESSKARILKPQPKVGHKLLHWQ